MAETFEYCERVTEDLSYYISLKYIADRNLAIAQNKEHLAR